MLSQLTNLIPSVKLPFSDRFTASIKTLPAGETHDLETATDRTARALKHLLKLNHANHAVLYRGTGTVIGYNHVPHLLSTAYLLGATPETLHDLYESTSRELENWKEYSDGMTTTDWRTFFGRREYQRAFVDFFLDEVVRMGYDWRHVVVEYLCEGKWPLVDCLVSRFGHPLIHLSYGIEMSSREVSMEALAMAATSYDCTHEYIDSFKSSSSSAVIQASSPLALFHRICNDTRLNDLITSVNPTNVSTLLTQHSSLITEYLHAAPLPLTPPCGLDLTPHFRAIQETAVTLLLCTTTSKTNRFDFFFQHLLTSTHALRVLFSFIPAKHHLSLLRQWYLLAIAVYIAQLRPEVRGERIEDVDVNGRDWEWVRKTAMSGEWAGDGHYIEGVRVLREMARTWEGDDGKDGEWYLKGAVRFVREFKGWSGIE